MIRCGDADSVNIGSANQFAKIKRLLNTLESPFGIGVGVLDPANRVFATCPVNFADSDELHVGLTKKLWKMVVIGHFAAADQSDCDPVGWRCTGAVTQGGGSDDGGCTGSCHT